MPMPGKLFVLEGPDGVGKSTLAKEISRYFNAIGTPCSYLAFPGNEEGTLGHLVYQIHHTPQQFNVEKITPASLQLLHVAAHLDEIEQRILPAIELGQYIILDRFWWSTRVYGVISGVKRNVLEAVLEVERKSWGKLLPTALFLIDNHKSFRPTEAISSWNKLRIAYHELAEEQQHEHPIRLVVNDGSIEKSLQAIIQAIGEVESLPHKSSDTNFQLNLLFPDSRKDIFSSILTSPNYTYLAPAKPTAVFDTYWRFASERQVIFFKKLKKELRPWTNDPILQKHKFTNVYRASDRVSQFLIKNVIYTGDQRPDEIFFRIILFKVFNHVETWRLLERHLGAVAWQGYSFERYDAIITKAMSEGNTVFSSAYIMPSGASSFGYSKKHRNFLRLIENMMIDEAYLRVTEMRSMREVFELLRSYPLIGDFLAYQYAIDINYSTLTDFSEMEFVVPGPGARDGIRKCFSDLGGLNEADIIRVVTEHQDESFAQLCLSFQSLFGRPLQLIDCQNLFCEVDKYARVAHPQVKGASGRTRIKHVYQSSSEPIEYWYPPKWGLNDYLQGL
jgi:thymidylate kinase